MRNIRKTGGRIAFLVVVTALLLLGTAASARPGGGYAVEEGTLTGGGYRLTAVSSPADSTMIGGGYQLLTLAKPTLRGSGCCCTYVPCLLRGW
jgi:hypothetical protein